MTIPSNNTPYIQRHINVVSSKKNMIKGVSNSIKTNLIALQPQIISRYNLFEQAIRNNTLFSFLEDSQLILHKNDLLSCYNRKLSKVKEITQLIESSQPRGFLRRCPYCGIILPKTYDHYLPESIFPELAVHPLNLIPCCSSCNSAKNNFFKSNTNRIFLYFYGDTIPNVQYLGITLIIKSNSIGANFNINIPNNIVNPVWNVLDEHYKRLDLISQYNEMVNDEITEIILSCRIYVRNGGRNISGYLNGFIIENEALFGMNHWRVVLMKALSNSFYFHLLIGFSKTI